MSEPLAYHTANLGVNALEMELWRQWRKTYLLRTGTDAEAAMAFLLAWRTIRFVGKPVKNP
jgi:hypothetical protein